VNQDRFFRTYIKNAQENIRHLVEKKTVFESLIHFESEYKKDKLSILPDSLILIKAADNYIEVFYHSKEGIKSQLIRSTLIKAGEQVSEYDFIFRCHRTFIVNIHHIKEIEGNSQGYRLYFEGIDFPALVSQRYIPVFKEKTSR
jgi:DNA-binding LytR/AlgR family response regulator